MTEPIVIRPFDRAELELTSPGGPILIEYTSEVAVDIELLATGPRGVRGEAGPPGPQGPDISIYQLPPAP